MVLPRAASAWAMLALLALAPAVANAQTVDGTVDPANETLIEPGDPWLAEEVGPPEASGWPGDDPYGLASGFATREYPLLGACRQWIGGRRPRLIDRLSERLSHLIFLGKRPLRTESWLNRPGAVSVFAGGLWGDDLIAGQVDSQSGFFTGFRFAWDFDHRWGLETRFGFADVNLQDPLGGMQLDTNDMFLWDASLLYYPWGQTRWRPYFIIGTGFADIDFVDDAGNRVKDTVLGLPFGGGLKVRLNRRLALRFEFLDNIALGSAHGMGTLHNISLTGGIELRFGGRRTSYWPWNPGRNWW